MAIGFLTKSSGMAGSALDLMRNLCLQVAGLAKNKYKLLCENIMPFFRSKLNTDSLFSFMETAINH